MIIDCAVFEEVLTQIDNTPCPCLAPKDVHPSLTAWRKMWFYPNGSEYDAYDVNGYVGTGHFEGDIFQITSIKNQQP